MRKLPKQTARENCRYEATYNAAPSPHLSLSEDLRAACCGTDLVDYYVATNLAASAPGCARSARLGVKAVPRPSAGLSCCSTYCLSTDSGAPPHVMMQ